MEQIKKNRESHQNPVHKAAFRLMSPLVYGSMVYIMVLLLNGRLSNLEENFEWFEWFFCIFLTLLVGEGLRLHVCLLDRYLPIERGMRIRLALQVLMGSLLAAGLAAGAVAAYFIWLVGFSSFTNELKIFSAIFLVSGLLYNLVHLSILLLHEQNRAVLEKENALRKNLEYRLQAFKNEVNPDLLYSSLETMLSLMKQDREQVETFIARLSNYYRFSLDNRHEELIALDKELHSAHNLIQLLKFTHRHIQLNVDIPSAVPACEVVPGAVSMLLQYLVRISIISEALPLRVHVQADDPSSLSISAKLNEKLQPIANPTKEIQDIQQAYAFYTDEPVVCVKAYQEITLKIPLLEPVTEAL